MEHVKKEVTHKFEFLTQKSQTEISQILLIKSTNPQV